MELRALVHVDINDKKAYGFHNTVSVSNLIAFVKDPGILAYLRHVTLTTSQLDSGLPLDLAGFDLDYWTIVEQEAAQDAQRDDSSLLIKSLAKICSSVDRLTLRRSDPYSYHLMHRMMREYPTNLFDNLKAIDIVASATIAPPMVLSDIIQIIKSLPQLRALRCDRFMPAPITDLRQGQDVVHQGYGRNTSSHETTSVSRIEELSLAGIINGAELPILLSLLPNLRRLFLEEDTALEDPVADHIGGHMAYNTLDIVLPYVANIAVGPKLQELRFFLPSVLDDPDTYWREPLGKLQSATIVELQIPEGCDIIPMMKALPSFVELVHLLVEEYSSADILRTIKQAGKVVADRKAAGTFDLRRVIITLPRHDRLRMEHRELTHGGVSFRLKLIPLVPAWRTRGFRGLNGMRREREKQKLRRPSV